MKLDWRYDMKNTTLYFGGTIITCDGTVPCAEAVLVSDGKILAVGEKKELARLSPEAVLFDLKGNTLLPGFIDGHSHLSGVGASFRKCDLTGCKNFQEILDRIVKFRKEKDLTHGEVIVCRGYDNNLLAEKSHPDRFLLDQLGIDNPVLCYHISGHMLGCNSAALVRAGVSSDFVPPDGGFCGRDESGNLSGYFEEKAKVAIQPLIASFSPEEFKEDILAAMEYYASFGYTTVQDGSSTSLEKYLVYKELAENGLLSLDTVLYLSFGTAKSLAEEEIPRQIGRLRIGGIKFFLDGSPQAKTAWLSKPYEGEENYAGYPTMSDDEVFEILSFAIENDLQPIAHCNGDAASEQFLSQWEKALAVNEKGKDLRPIMIHAQTVRQDQLVRMKKCGMMASFFIGHCHFWGDTHLKNLGERALSISPAGTALSLGIPFSLHQDSPVTPPNMLHSIHCAVNRKTQSGVILNENEKLTAVAAVFAATSGGAYGYFEEERKGVIKKGALADFVVLNEDPTELPVEKIQEISVLATVKEGSVVYQKA